MLGNLTDGENPTYWHYKVNTNITTIKLEEFIAMGKTQSDKYSAATGINIIEEKILIIVDFSQCNEEEHMSEGTYTIKMQLTGINETIEDFSSDELEFSIKKKRIFELENDESIIAGNDFVVSYSMQEAEGTESKYEGRKLSLVLTAPDDIPTDINLTTQNTIYYLNSKRQFIIPLGDMQKQSDVITMKICSNMFSSKSSEYNFDIALWVSATANAHAPMLGEKVDNSSIIVTTEEKLQPALKVTNMSKRIFHKDELNNNNSVTYKYMSATNCTVTVELQQKVGIAYQKITDKLNQVNGTTNHNMGVFNISATQDSNQLSFKLSSMTSAGTYRLVFKVNDEEGKKLLEIPYNFIVTE